MKLQINKAEDHFILLVIKNEKTEVLRTLMSCSLNWEYIFTTVVKNKIKALFSKKILEYGLPPSVIPPKVNKFVRLALIESDISLKIYREELARLSGLFGSKGISYILLKGLSIDFGEVRDIGDLDILIEDTQLPVAACVLKEIGYVYNQDTKVIKVKTEQLRRIELQLSWNTHFGFYNPEKQLLIELHTNLFEKKYVYKEDLTPLLSSIGMCWEGRVFDYNLKCDVLSIEDRLLLACMHFAIKHSPQKNIFTLRRVVDIKNILFQIENYERFLSIVYTFRMEAYVVFSLEFTMRMFGLPQIRQLVSSLKQRLTKTELFLNRIHTRCFYSFEKSSLLYTKVYRFILPFIFGGRTIDKIKSIFLFEIFFPPKSRLEALFNIDRKSPFFFVTYLLNPIRWMFLIVRRLIR